MYCPQKKVITRKYCKTFKEYLQLVKYNIKQYKNKEGYIYYVDKELKCLVIEGLGNNRFLY